MSHDAESPQSRAERELSGKRAYPKRDLLTEVLAEDRLWADLCATCDGQSEESIEEEVYRPRQLRFLDPAEGMSQVFCAPLPLDGATPQEWAMWRRLAGNAHRALRAEIRRKGGGYYGCLTLEPDPSLEPDLTPEPEDRGELVPYEHAAPLAAPQPPPPASRDKLDRLLDHLLSEKGPPWIQQIIGGTAGTITECMIHYRIEGTKEAERARLRVELEHMRAHAEELHQLRAEIEELEALRRYAEELRQESPAAAPQRQFMPQSALVGAR